MQVIVLSDKEPNCVISSSLHWVCPASEKLHHSLKGPIPSLKN